MNEKLQQQLLDLGRQDEEARTRLLAEGRLFDGYAPEMEQVHLEHATRLQRIIDEYGWPGVSLVGEDGAQAAWLIAQHAISNPPFQQACLVLITQAVQSNEVPPSYFAFLTDRILYNQRKPQQFGTVFDWDEDAEVSPWTIEDVENVDKRRASVGLPPLDQAVATMRREAAIEGSAPAASHAKRQQQVEEWARRVGWIS
jgi:hypothetical protein